MNGVSGESQARRFEVLQPLELGEDVHLGPHLADIYFESDERAEDGRELRLNEVIDGIGQREFRVREFIMRAAPTTSRSWLTTALSPQDDPERPHLDHRPTEFKSGLLGGRIGACVDLAWEGRDDEAPPSVCHLCGQLETGALPKLVRFHHLEKVYI